MTLGQRIQALRRSMDLSQEGLGERLGVSRQAISKWEADAAVPEIDKLIALAKLFGVSLDELLGVETAPGEEPSPAEEAEAPSVPPEEGEELPLDTAELAEAARKRRQQRRALELGLGCLIAAGVIAAALFAGHLVRRVNDLEGQMASIGSEIGAVRSSVSSQIGSITSRIEAALAEQENLLAGYNWAVAGADPDGGTVDLDVKAVPKTDVEGMEGTFLLKDGLNTIASAPGTLDRAENSFAAKGWTVPATGWTELWVTFGGGGESRNQYVETILISESDISMQMLAWRQNREKGVVAVQLEVGWHYDAYPVRLEATGGGVTVAADLDDFPEGGTWGSASAPAVPATPAPAGGEAVSTDPLSRWQGCGVTFYLPFSGGYPDGPITVELEDSRGRIYRAEI